jgi:hypothetical protein
VCTRKGPEGSNPPLSAESDKVFSIATSPFLLWPEPFVNSAIKENIELTLQVRNSLLTLSYYSIPQYLKAFRSSLDLILYRIENSDWKGLIMRNYFSIAAPGVGIQTQILLRTGI